MTGYNRALSIREDPFAAREGKRLIWKDLNMTLTGKGDQEDRKLLSNVWGQVPEKEITAVMGPSGAGKTSLLNILAGRSQSRGRLVIEADVRLNNYRIDPTNLETRKQIAFVPQDDSLQVTATPREAIRFSAKLRLARATTEDELDILTMRMLEELGLQKCSDTIVGGELIKGISGGERKRTSVGVELVTKPALVFLDEPTSGLDSFSAVQLVQVLKKVANAGSSVLFTIHQPSSEIFNAFDQVILMNKGSVMYQGSVAEVPDFFRGCGHAVPPKYNPADWIMNVAQSTGIQELRDAGFFPPDTREFGEAFEGENEEGKDALGITQRHHLEQDFDNRPVPLSTEISMLFKREVVHIQRDTAGTFTKFGLNIFLGILIGIIFFDVGSTDSAKTLNIQSHFGAIVISLMMGMFGTAQESLLQFPRERPVFLREYSTNHYSVVSYFLSKVTMELVLVFVQNFVLCIILFFMVDLQMNFMLFVIIMFVLSVASSALAVALGSVVSDVKMAAEMLPLLFVPQMLFAGFFVASELIPVWLRWAQYLCTLFYAVMLIVLAEFSDCDEGEATKNCNQIIDNVGADEDNKWWYWLILVTLMVGFRVGALALLREKANKFY